MERVVVIGTSGTGKTTVARALADRLGVAHLELDAVHHLPGWRPLPTERFRDEIAHFLGRHDRWVVDGNYAAVRDLLWPVADTVVWLDLSRARTMWRITTRSLRRVVTREVLWNGNRERLGMLLSWDPEASIIRWAWTTHARRRWEYPQLLSDPRWGPLTCHRLRTPRQVARLVESAAPAT